MKVNFFHKVISEELALLDAGPGANPELAVRFGYTLQFNRRGRGVRLVMWWCDWEWCG